ncbi:hypothetical protein C8R45DRAFT_1131368 [Mycena sanguinolenta]|nr:hypothetical protein C8R45DRAFT_1131368 [Mycena sanguinolenta]
MMCVDSLMAFILRLGGSDEELVVDASLQENFLVVSRKQFLSVLPTVIDAFVYIAPSNSVAVWRRMFNLLEQLSETSQAYRLLPTAIRTGLVRMMATLAVRVPGNVDYNLEYFLTKLALTRALSESGLEARRPPQSLWFEHDVVPRTVAGVRYSTQRSYSYPRRLISPPIRLQIPPSRIPERNGRGGDRYGVVHEAQSWMHATACYQGLGRRRHTSLVTPLRASSSRIHNAVRELAKQLPRGYDSDDEELGEDAATQMAMILAYMDDLVQVH